MTRVVIDTNVYISAVLFGGLPGYLLDLALLRSFEVVISRALLEELEEKLRLKFKVSPEDAAAICGRIGSVAHLVEPREALRVIQEDPDDDRVLECAVEGKAEYIVSGDRHLLKLGKFRGVPVVRVREFLDSIETEPNE